MAYTNSLNKIGNIQLKEEMQLHPKEQETKSVHPFPPELSIFMDLKSLITKIEHAHSVISSLSDFQKTINWQQHTDHLTHFYNTVILYKDYSLQRDDFTAFVNKGYFPFIKTEKEEHFVKYFLNSNESFQTRSHRSKLIVDAIENDYLGALNILLRHRKLNWDDKQLGLTYILENMIKNPNLQNALGVYFRYTESIGKEIMSLALNSDFIKEVILILKTGMLKINDSEKTHLLAIACLQKNEDVIDILLKQGVDINNTQNSPLLLAVMSNKSSVVELLLKKEGFDINTKDQQNNNALHYVMCHERSTVRMLNLLLSIKNIDINARNINGRSPIMCFNKSTELKKFDRLLKDARCDPNIIGNNGQNAMIKAINEGRFDIIKSLLNCERFDPTTRKTIYYGQVSLCDYLLVYMAEHINDAEMEKTFFEKLFMLELFSEIENVPHVMVSFILNDHLDAVKFYTCLLKILGMGANEFKNDTDHVKFMKAYAMIYWIEKVKTLSAERHVYNLSLQSSNLSMQHIKEIEDTILDTKSEVLIECFREQGFFLQRPARLQCKIKYEVIKLMLTNNMVPIKTLLECKITEKEIHDLKLNLLKTQKVEQEARVPDSLLWIY